MNSKELAIICKKLSILLSSGTEITKSLIMLSNHQSKRNNKIIQEVYKNIQQGNNVTESFTKTNKFPSFFINMIKVGELTGNLDEVMTDLSTYYDKENQIKNQIINILTYPTILSIISLASMLFILIYVIPNFENIFLVNSVEPPLSTSIVINISKKIRENPYSIIAAIGLTLSLLVYVLRSNKFGSKIKSQLKLSIPYVKQINLTIATTRICRTLEILIKSGVNIIDAIDMSAKVVNNYIIQERLEITKRNIIRGKTISYSLKKANIFHASLITMIEVGEESGSLDYTLKMTNEFYSDELKSSMERMGKMIEPLITVVLGIIVGGLIVSMVMPMYDVINTF